MINDYKKLKVWEKAVVLVSEIYSVTKNFPNDERFGLTSQIRRAAVSIPSNIAEGKLRGGDVEFRRFLLIAFGSGGELETQIEIALKLGFINNSDYEKINSTLSEVMKMLNVLITKLGASR